MKNLPQIVHALHREYCARTGHEIPINMMWERVWWDWLTFNREPDGFTLEDLKLVIAYLRSQIRIGKRNDGALLIRNMISQPDRFQEDLCLARKWREENGPRRPRVGLVSTAAAAPEPVPMTEEERAAFRQELEDAKLHKRREGA